MAVRHDWDRQEPLASVRAVLGPTEVADRYPTVRTLVADWETELKALAQRRGLYVISGTPDDDRPVQDP